MTEFLGLFCWTRRPLSPLSPFIPIDHEETPSRLCLKQTDPQPKGRLETNTLIWRSTQKVCFETINGVQLSFWKFWPLEFLPLDSNNLPWSGEIFKIWQMLLIGQS